MLCQTVIKESGEIGRPQALLIAIALLRILFSHLASDSASETP
jgi:hypothetical protein